MMDKTASKKEIGNFIKARMLEKGLATRDLAESAGVSEAAVRPSQIRTSFLLSQKPSM